MRTLLVSLLLALALSGCTTGTDTIDNPDAVAEAAARSLADDMGPEGDIARIDMTMDMAMQTDDFQMEMGLVSATTLLQGDALRMTVGITRAVFDGEDQTEEMADVEIFVACDPDTLTFRLTGMEAMGGEDAQETIPNELGTCLDTSDPEDLARMVEESESMEGQLAGLVPQLLNANRVMEMNLTSAQASGGVVEATYTVEFQDIVMDMVATVADGRIVDTRMDYAMEQLGLTMAFHATYEYGPRAAS